MFVTYDLLPLQRRKVNEVTRTPFVRTAFHSLLKVTCVFYINYLSPLHTAITFKVVSRSCQKHC